MPDMKQTPTNPDTPPVRSPDKGGVPNEVTTPAGDDSAEAPPAPRTSGGSAPHGEAFPNPVANRNTGKTGAPRQAGVTPRPTDKPLGE